METFKTVLNSGASHRWNAFKLQSKTAYVLLFGIVSVVILLLCGGCGGDSNNDSVTSVTTTGQFIDDTVQGLEYSCSSGNSGVTNSRGEYTCNAGDDVTFYLGAVSLGTVAAQGSLISPYNLFPGNEEAAINLARLLQSLDSDNDPDNGVIVLNEALIALLPADTDFASASFTDDIESALPAPFSLISAADAKAHLEEQIVLHGGVLPNRGVAPVADAGLDQGVIVGTPANLDASNSSDADGDDLTYQWRLVTYPSGSISSFSDDSIFNPTFTAETEGVYTLQLEVNDGIYSAFDTVTITFSASNSRPVANAGPDRGVAPDTMVTLDGSGSQDADGDDLSYSWIFVGWPSDSPPILEFPGSPSPRFVARDEGIYTLELTVDDGTEESLPDEVNITCQVAVPDTPPVLAWSVEPFTIQTERALDIAIDSSGNSYVTGYTGGALDGETSNGNYDIFITKYDTDGVRQWTVLNGTTAGSGEMAHGIAIDNSRGVLYVTGNTYGALNGIPKPSGTDIWTDTFISKYDLDGNRLWTVMDGAVGSDYSLDVAVDSAGNVYVTGKSNNVIFTSKYDPDGAHQWTVQPDANPGGTGNGIALDAENNVYVVGTANSDLDNNPSNGSQDIFITKYTTDGDRLWTRLLGTDNYEMGSAIAVVAGNIYITGHTYGDFPGGSNQGDRDIFIAKYDTDGARQWIEQLGTPLAEEGWGIALDSASNIYVSGYTAGALIGNVNKGQQDYFITKHDNDGQLLWALQDGGTSLDWFFDLAIDSADNIYAAGGITVSGQSTNIIIEKYGDNTINNDGLYTVGGTVASTIYEVFSLTNSNGDVIEINDIGEFVFPTGLPNGASYSVEADTSEFGGQTCTVTGGSNGDGTGIIDGADVTDILVTCTGV